MVSINEKGETTLTLHKGFDASFIDGEWQYLFKAVTPEKKHTKEKPAFKVIEDIEEHYLNLYEETLVNIVKEIAK
jgi:hypothetical protein